MSMIVGLTGRNAAGKGTAAEYLEKKGFLSLSLSDAVREACKARGKPLTRENLIETGRLLRRALGPGVLATRIVEQLATERNYVIDSIRSPAEIKVLSTLPDFHLWEITAPLNTRFKRAKKRGLAQDSDNFSKFKALEAKERKKSKAGQDLDGAAKMAETRLSNTGTFKQFYVKLDKALAALPQHFHRPRWDRYFMQVAKVVSTRSNCVKRKVASIIVRDKRIISTGYNGTPRGVKNCNESGCPRCNAFTDSGKSLDECLCSHGEENAIVQGSYHGISLKDSTLYSTLSPCVTCTKMIINAGIRRVVYNEEYPLGETAKNLLKEAGVELVKLRL